MNNDQVNGYTRPVFLTVLCVIAFIHVGLSIISGTLGIIFSPELGWFRSEGVFGLFTDSMGYIGFKWSLIMLVFSIIAFIGIIQIWNMNRLGVWFFAIPLFFTMIIPLFLMGLAWWRLIPNITIVFFLIFLFAINYQNLARKNFSS
jgi:hypothetical protein